MSLRDMWGIQVQMLTGQLKLKVVSEVTKVCGIAYKRHIKKLKKA